MLLPPPPPLTSGRCCTHCAATWHASVLLASLHEWNGVRYLRYSDLAISGGSLGLARFEPWAVGWS